MFNPGMNPDSLFWGLHVHTDWFPSEIDPSHHHAFPACQPVPCAWHSVRRNLKPLQRGISRSCFYGSWVTLTTKRFYGLLLTSGFSAIKGSLNESPAMVLSNTLVYHFLVFDKIRGFTVLMDEVPNPLIDQLMGNMIFIPGGTGFFPSAGFGFPLACCACKKKHDNTW